MAKMEPPAYGYPIIKAVGKQGITYTDLLIHAPLVEMYGDLNRVAGEVHKLIALSVISTEKTYSPEEGDDYILSLTKYGLNILKHLQSE